MKSFVSIVALSLLAAAAANNGNANGNSNGNNGQSNKLTCYSCSGNVATCSASTKTVQCNGASNSNTQNADRSGDSSEESSSSNSQKTPSCYTQYSRDGSQVTAGCTTTTTCASLQSTNSAVCGSGYYAPTTAPSDCTFCCTGTQCNVVRAAPVTNPCSNVVCENGGSCNVVGTSQFSCTCQPGYSGTTCTTVGYTCQGYNNPCTAENAAKNQFFFSNPDPTKFVQCSGNGQCVVMSCPPGLTWNQASQSCTSTAVTSPCTAGICANGGSCTAVSTSQFSCTCQPGYSGTTCTTAGYTCEGSNNPCTAANAANNQFFFPNPDPTKFVQCSGTGKCIVMSCPPGLTWNESTLACN